MLYIAIQPYQTNYPNPITIKKGDLLEIGEEDSDPDGWKGWFFCKTTDRVSGWVPRQVLHWTSEDAGYASSDYSAKEMNIKEGEQVIVLHTLNGWGWSRSVDDSRQGWLPLDVLQPV